MEGQSLDNRVEGESLDTRVEGESLDNRVSGRGVPGQPSGRGVPGYTRKQPSGRGVPGYTRKHDCEQKPMIVSEGRREGKGGKRGRKSFLMGKAGWGGVGLGGAEGRGTCRWL